MINAPEIITKTHWRYHPEDLDSIGDAMEQVQYICSDISQALIAAAYESVTSLTQSVCCDAPHTDEDLNQTCCGNFRIVPLCPPEIMLAVRALAPADAKAAYDKAIADAEHRGATRAADIALGDFSADSHDPQKKKIADAIRAQLHVATNAPNF
jgi:hypothetical protein